MTDQWCWDPIVERTDECSAAFLCAVIRRTALQGGITRREAPSAQSLRHAGCNR